MGGNIDVDSVYGEGAVFRFYITAIAAEPLLDVVAQGSSSPSKSLTSKGKGFTSRSSATTARNDVLLAPTSQTAYHILITEDNLINQTVLNRQLKQAGFTTALASNGQQAIEQIKKLARGNDVTDDIPRQFNVILVCGHTYNVMSTCLVYCSQMDCEMPVMDGLTVSLIVRLLGHVEKKNTVFH